MGQHQQKRILYIENEALLCELFEVGLKPFGYCVDTSLTGSEGLALWAENHYDLVAIDYLLPDTNGIDIARQLLSESPELPVLIITGVGNADIAVEALRLGVSNYVTKGDSDVYLKLMPVLIDKLLTSVEDKARSDKTAKELEINEKRFRDFAESAADFYWETDENHKFTFLSDSYEEITGIPVNRYLGKTRDKSLFPGIDDKIWNQHEEKIQSRKAFKDFFHFRVGPDRIVTWLSASGQPVFDSDGKFRGYRGIGRNITDQKNAELTLSQNEKILSAALESIDGRAAIYDSDGNLLYYNSRYLAVHLGGDENLYRGLNFAERVKKLAYGDFLINLDTDREKWIEERLELFEKGGHARPVRDANGRWFDPNFYKIEGGGTFVVSLDTTNLIEAEETAARNGKRFKEIAATTADRFWETDKDHLFTYISGTGWNDTFVPPLDVIGKTRWGVMGVDPSENEMWQKHKETLDAHLPFRNFTYFFTPSMGNSRYISVNGNPQFDQEGNFIGYIGTANDVTEMKKVEVENERLASAIDNLDILVSLYDSDDRLVRANKKAMEVFAGSNARFEVGMSFEEVVNEMVSLGAVEEAFGREEEWIKERLYLHQHMTTPVEVSRENGHSYIVRDQRLPDGSISSVAIDNTHLKAMEKQLRQSQRMEAIGQLTGGIAHDFNNLLGVMMGNAEMLEFCDSLDEAAQQNLKGIIKATDRAAALTERLLAFSNQQNLAPVTSNLNDLLSNFEDLLNRTLGETVSLHIGHDPESWSVMIDPNQFENAILNLAINARDAMLNGGAIHIDLKNTVLKQEDVKTLETNRSGEFVKIVITDTGEGIPKEAIGHVFEPFFTTKGVGKGSGLGLSMVYGFIQQSNGYIDLDSEVGIGTKVTIYLPRTTENIKSPVSDVPSAKAQKGTERILVVEDDEGLRFIPVTALKEMGYDVDEAGNSDEALALLDKEKPYDLLFTDIVLPGKMNGIMIAQEFLKVQPNIKVVYTTGYADDVASNAELLNISDWLLRKPYHLSQMLNKIRNALDDMVD